VPGSLCATKPMSRLNRIARGILATGVVALAAFPYYSGSVARLVVRQPGPAPAVASANLSTVSLQVPDMDCPACAVALPPLSVSYRVSWTRSSTLRAARPW